VSGETCCGIDTELETLTEACSSDKHSSLSHKGTAYGHKKVLQHRTWIKMSDILLLLLFKELKNKKIERIDFCKKMDT
jgi:hypothetical protein